VGAFFLKSVALRTILRMILRRNMIIQIDSKPVEVLTADDARAYVGGSTILKMLCDLYGLRPFHRTGKAVYYRTKRIDAALDRMEAATMAKDEAS